jgi:hypothetical protein
VLPVMKNLLLFHLHIVSIVAIDVIPHLILVDQLGIVEQEKLTQNALFVIKNIMSNPVKNDGDVVNTVQRNVIV